MDRIKVVHAHNFYLQAGGEDTAFSTEVELLRANGQEVVEYIEHNKSIKSRNSLVFGIQTMWSWDTYRKLTRLLEKERPDIVHFHNTFPLISPSAYFACRKAKVPAVQSLDNARLLCPSANFYRNGKSCQDCLGKTPPWPGIVHRCYHNSCLHSAAVASMLTLHRWLGTWNRMVEYFVVATSVYKNLFVAGGLPPEKIVIKPHFIHPDPGARSAAERGKYALFIGRLDQVKGIPTLLAAWKGLSDIPLFIRGNGSLENDVQRSIRDEQLRGSIQRLERMARPELMDKIKGARFLLWPSEGYYETFGFVAVESFSCGVPVIASRIGVLAEIVRENVTGLLFTPGDPADLAAKVRWAWDHPAEMDAMGKNARREYEARYTAKENYPKLMEIYRQAIENYH